MDTHTPLRKRAGWPGCAEWGTGVGGPLQRKWATGDPQASASSGPHTCG